MDFLLRLFDTEGFPPRWQCGTAWAEEPALGWVHIGSDLVTWLAYLLIPCVLAYYVVRKKEVSFPRVFWLFCAFILACGTVHLLEAVTFWTPVYRLSAALKVITAVTSGATVIALARVAPDALSLPGLSEVNAKLRKEVNVRKSAERDLLKVNEELQAALEKAEAVKARLRDSEAKLRGLVDNTRTFIGLMTPEGILIDANRTSLAAAGVSADDVLNKPFWEAPWWSHSEALRERLRQATANAATGKADQFEATHPTDKGTLIDVDFSLSPICSSSGEVLYLVPEGHDISTEKQLRKEAEASERKMRLTFEASPSGLIVVNKEGVITMVNPQLTAMFGYREDELLGEKIEILLPERYRGAHIGHRNGYQANRETRSMGSGRELYGRRKDGSEVPLEIGLTPIDEASGSTMATINDISERKRNQRSIQQKNEQLSRLNSELLEFAYSASHDLKAPLASISGLMRFCESDLIDGDVEEVRANIKKAKELAERLANRVESVLALAKSDMESGTVESIPVEQRVRDAWEALPHDGVSLEISIQHEEPFQSVSVRFDAIVENLLSNAIKYQDPEQRDKNVRVSTWSRNDDFYLSVEDNGVGIPQEYQDKVFRLFHRLDKSDTSGTGLGLPLVKKSVARLGGLIELRSGDGKTTFTVTLPQSATLNPMESI